jgi:hypothetical protein
LKKSHFLKIQAMTIRQIYKQKPNSNLNSEEFKRKEETLTIDKILTKPLKKENNVYLQVLSSLSKINNDEINKEESAKKLKEFLKDEKVEINDKKILKIIDIESMKGKDDLFIDQVKKIIDAEMSEEEFVEKTQHRFVRPPHTPEELKKVLEQSEKIYEESKQFLFINDRHINQDYEETFKKKIPKFFTMRKMVYPPTKSEILVCGVRRNSNIHSVFLSKVLEKLNPDAIMVQMPPDDPIFIETGAGEDYQDGIENL